jgi:hypothetical protein
MWRCCVFKCGLRPGAECWVEITPRDKTHDTRIEVIQRRVDERAVDPDDAFTAVIDSRSPVGIVIRVMRLEVTVHDRRRMVIVRFVRVQRRERRCRKQERRDENGRRQPRPKAGHGVDYVGRRPVRQTRALTQRSGTCQIRALARLLRWMSEDDIPRDSGAGGRHPAPTARLTQSSGLRCRVPDKISSCMRESLPVWRS